MTVLLDYFRRPVLAGNTLTRQNFGTVRGDIRRHDVDGTSTVPYFPGITAAQTLIFSIDGGGPTSVAFNGSPPGGLANVISALNTALGINGIAYDADGCVAIQTNTQGSAGSIEITGGTAAAALGFDLSINTFKSYGGEVPSTPEGRIGNSFRTAFPSKGENLTSDTLKRSLSMLASNSDLLFSDLARNDAVLRKVNYSTSDQTRLQLSTATDELFTGLGLLSRLSTKDDLVPYFYLVDPATNHISQSRVVAVVRGVPGGSPPFADATTWSGGGSAGNILGVTLTKTTGVIDRISDGRVIKSSAANFTDAQVGDFVEISGATNTKQWSNNGNRWVVEAILGTNSVIVRPMSKSEMALVGFTPTEIQPILELNTELSGVESYGTVTVRTGTYCSGIGVGISVVVSPPMPTGASFDLYVAQPNSMRSKTVFDDLKSASLPFKDLVSDLAAFSDGTVSGLVPSLGGGSVSITAGVIRWRGRVYGLPSITFIGASFTDNATTYVYWDDSTTDYVKTTVPSNFTNLYDPGTGVNKGHLIAIVTKAAGIVTTVTQPERYVADAARSITVGTGGQFATLDQAFLYANAYAAGFGETSSSSGNYPHFEFVLVNDSTYAGQSLLTPSAIIRGVSPATKLTMSDGFNFGGAGTLQVQDLTVATSGTVLGFVKGSVSLTSFSTRIINVTQSSGHFGSVVLDGAGGSNPSTVYIQSSKFTVDTNVVKGTPAGGLGDIRLVDSRFTYNGGSAPQIVANTGAATWGGVFLKILGCIFDGNWLTTSANSLLVNASSASSQVFVEGSTFTLGAHASASRNFMTVSTGKCTFRGNKLTGGMASIITGQANTLVLGNYIECIGGSAETAIDAGHIVSNEIVQLNNGGASGSNGCRPQVECIGNYVHGPFFSAIRNNSASDIKIHGNRIELSDSTNKLNAGIWLEGGSNISVVGNSIKISGVTANVFSCILVASTTPVTNCDISHNTLKLDQPFGSNESFGINTPANTGSTSFTISGNQILCPSGTFSELLAMNVPNIENLVISGNLIQVLDSAGGFGITLGNGVNVTVVGNYVHVSNTPINEQPFVLTPNWVISGNTFITETTGQGVDIQGTIIGNRFDVAGGATSHQAIVTGCRFEGNYVNGNVEIFSDGVPTAVTLDGNTITGDIDAVTDTPDFTELVVTGNYVGGAFNITTATALSLVATGNAVVGGLTHQAAGGRALYSNNDTGGMSLGFGSVAASYVYVSGCSGVGLSIVASQVDLVDSKFSSNVAISRGATPASTSTHLTGCLIGGTLTTRHFYAHVGGNTLASVAHVNGTGGGQYVFEHNNMTGQLDVDNSNEGGAIVDSAIIDGNYFGGAGGINQIILATDCTFTNNQIIQSGTPGLHLSGTRVTAVANSMFNKTFTSANTKATQAQFTGQTLVIEDNYIYGHVLVDDHADLFFCRNNITSQAPTASQGAVHVGASSNSFLIEGNYIDHDLGLIATDGLGACIKFTSASGSFNGRITNNRLYFAVTSPAYSANTTMSVIWSPGGFTQRIIISGNVITKPANLTVAGPHTVTIDYVLFNGGATSETVLTGNLMDAGGTTGATVRQGGTSYTAGPSTFTLAE